MTTSNVQSCQKYSQHCTKMIFPDIRNCDKKKKKNFNASQISKECLLI